MTIEQKNYWIYPTRRCNLKCEYCYQPRETKNMDEKTARKVCDFLLRDEIEKRKKKLIQFFGGEPMLAFDVIQFFVERLEKNPDFKFSITTNGTLLDAGSLQFLKDKKFGFALSLDGPPGITRKTRPGSEKVNIDLIYEYFPNAQIIMTFSPANIADGYRATEYFLEKGFRSIAHNIDTQKPWPAEAVRNHHLVFEKLTDYALGEIRAGRKEPGFMYIGFAKKAVNGSRSPREKKNICGSNPNLLSIDSNGDIYPCQDMVTCDREKEYLLGNVIDGYIPAGRIPLEAMNFENPEKCRVCWFFHQCVGGCGPKNLKQCGDRYKANQNCCDLYAKQAQEGIRFLLNAGRLALYGGEEERRPM